MAAETVEIKVYNNSRFTDLLKRTRDVTLDIMIKKGSEYAGNVDRLAAFRRNAAALNLSKEQILLVYAEKHWGAIQSYVAAGNQVSSEEPIAGRVYDLINYLTFFLAMLDENGEIL